MNSPMTICNSHIYLTTRWRYGWWHCLQIAQLRMKCQKNYLKNIGINFELLSKRLIINNIVKNINESLSDYSGIRPTMWRGWGSLSKKMELNKWGPIWAYLGLSGPIWAWSKLYLSSMNTVFIVKQNNSHEDCSIFNLNLLRPCR